MKRVFPSVTFLSHPMQPYDRGPLVFFEATRNSMDDPCPLPFHRKDRGSDIVVLSKVARRGLITGKRMPGSRFRPEREGTYDEGIRGAAGSDEKASVHHSPMH